MILPVIWPDYWPWRSAFAEAMDPRLYSLEYLDGLITSGKALFWSTERAAIIAEVKHYPTGAKDIHGLIAAGAIEEIIDDLIPQAESWAIANGCIGAIIDSRSGWQKILRPYGYRPFQMAVRKELC